MTQEVEKQTQIQHKIYENFDFIFNNYISQSNKGVNRRKFMQNDNTNSSNSYLNNISPRYANDRSALENLETPLNNNYNKKSRNNTISMEKNNISKNRSKSLIQNINISNLPLQNDMNKGNKENNDDECY